MRDGYGHSGSKVRAYCSCGYGTTPRASQERADAALTADHDLDPPVCALCERDRGPATDPGGRWRDLEILTIPPLGQTPYGDRADTVDDVGTVDDGIEQVLVCRTDKNACRDLSDQRMLHLDRAAFEGFGLEFEAPRLRALPGGPAGLSARRGTVNDEEGGRDRP
ncbi:hypothetical protein [Kribbella sp. NPDC048928]|uniref:hypothetical protein n=1 Tax=Kribbella sp. NPDC048928 TaxID=3364111 RepID=UPI0037216524